VIVLRMILGGLLGLIVRSLAFGLLVTVAGSTLGSDNREFAISFAPFGGLLGMGIGATWQLLRSDRKR
jgi:hypothetical protein